MPARTKGQPPGDLHGWHRRRRAMRRPLADILGRAVNHQIRWLATKEIIGQARSGFFCEAWFCRRGVTCVAFFDYRHHGRLLYGETYMCTTHGERRAVRCHVQIQGPPQEGEMR
jgi:hypothetical protein